MIELKTIFFLFFFFLVPSLSPHPSCSFIFHCFFIWTSISTFTRNLMIIIMVAFEPNKYWNIGSIFFKTKSPTKKKKLNKKKKLYHQIWMMKLADKGYREKHFCWNIYTLSILAQKFFKPCVCFFLANNKANQSITKI